jgi:hypothetical protein
MAKKYTRIEDIADELTVDLDTLGFQSLSPKKDEVLRYRKKGNNFSIQIGLEQSDNDSDQPEYNNIYLTLNYGLPSWIQDPKMNVLPDAEQMSQFFRNSPISNHQRVLNTDKSKEGQRDLLYQIGFKKDRTTPDEMRVVLREAIDYFCNYATANLQMLVMTERFNRKLLV